jgi:hypothetical protein
MLFCTYAKLIKSKGMRKKYDLLLAKSKSKAYNAGKWHAGGMTLKPSVLLIRLLIYCA